LQCHAAVTQNSGAKRTFNVPAQRAEFALKAFSEQSGKSVIMNANTVDGIRTNRVRGAFTPLEALQHMLAGTGLIATPDEKSDAFVVHREDNPPKGRTPPEGPSGEDASSPETSYHGKDF